MAIWWQVSAKNWFTGPEAHHRPGRRRRVRRLTESTDCRRGALLDRIPVLAGRPRTVTRPAGRADQPQPARRDDAGPRLRRAGLPRATPACSASTGTPSTRTPASAAEAGVGARVVDYRPDLGMLVIDLPAGHDARERDRSATPRCCARAADACRRLHAGPRFSGDFDMFRRQADVPRARCASTATGSPTGTTTTPTRGSGYGARSRSAPRPTVPCNNDLLAGNFVDDGDRMWLIDYEYSGNNDAVLRARQHRHRVRPQPTSRSRRWSRRTSGGRGPHLPRPGAACSRWCSEYGWSLWGFIQAATSPSTSTSTGWGQERFDKAVRRFRGDRLRRAARRGRPVAELPARARVVIIGGGVIGMLGGLPPRPARAGPTCCCSSRARCRAAPRGTRPDWSARCAPSRAAPAWCSTPPSSTPGSRRRPGWPPATASAAG